MKLSETLTSGDRLRGIWTHTRGLLLKRRTALALGLFVTVLNRASVLVIPYSTKFLLDDVIARHRVDLVITLIIIISGATLIQGLSGFAQTKILSAMAHHIIADLRVMLQERLVKLCITYHDEHSSGALVSRVFSNVEDIRTLIGSGLIELVGGLSSIILVFVVLAHTSLIMTVLAMLFFSTFIYILMQFTAKYRYLYDEHNRIRAQVMGRLTESIHGIRVIKAFCAEARESSNFASGLRKLLVNTERALVAISSLNCSTTVIMGILSASLMFIGAHEVLASRLSVGEYVTYLVLLGFLFSPLSRVVEIGFQVNQALAGLEQALEVMREPTERASIYSLRRTVIQGHIRFEHVGFWYQSGQQILLDVNFSSEPGKVTAIVGASGSGKSTIVNLLARFYSPCSGHIWIDGVNLASVCIHEYRRQVGLVSQECFLFDGTILDNIALAKPLATREEIIGVCRVARVDEFAERLKDKYDAVIGERGIRLSGGQRQRIAIARALIAEPRIMVYDEAMSNLDLTSAYLLQRELEKLNARRTTIIVSHRLGQIRHADEILVLDRGRLVESGTHEELIAMEGHYWKLYLEEMHDNGSSQDVVAAVH
jgi:ABC-type multidrug transport system fused ATPase/permease subunit